MADVLTNLKEKFRYLTLAYEPPNGMLCLDLYPGALVEELRVAMNLKDIESINKVHESVEYLISLRRAGGCGNIAWCSTDEWVETVCWHMLKKTRINAAKWRYWVTTMFDVVDADKNGYINTDQFNMFYLNTNRKNDTKFLERAFASVDTSGSGRVSRQQYGDAYTAYMTDPDSTYTQLPLF